MADAIQAHFKMADRTGGCCVFDPDHPQGVFGCPGESRASQFFSDGLAMAFGGCARLYDWNDARRSSLAANPTRIRAECTVLVWLAYLLPGPPWQVCSWQSHGHRHARRSTGAAGYRNQTDRSQYFCGNADQHCSWRDRWECFCFLCSGVSACLDGGWCRDLYSLFDVAVVATHVSSVVGHLGKE